MSRQGAMSIVGRRSVEHRTRSHALNIKDAGAGARIRGAGAATETQTKIRRGRIRRRPLVTTTAARPAARASESRNSGSRRSKILKQILEQMGEATEVQQIEVDAETVELEIKGDGSGILIGRHGQTLDALEYIVNRILARRIKDAAPISLETESYRARRRQQLHRMALSMGEKAKREHKPVRLEPMAPRDRRVVHLALKEDPMITTRSAGEGLMRSIEIMPTDSSGRPENRGGGRIAGVGATVSAAISLSLNARILLRASAKCRGSSRSGGMKRLGSRGDSSTGRRGSCKSHLMWNPRWVPHLLRQG